MEALIHVIETYGLWVVFISVLLDQGGLPTPSYAPMIVTAALAADAGQPLWPILLVGTVAALVADIAWFAGGRRYGAQLLRLMCRISLSPDSCVGTTRRIYEKWGAPSLMLAKYIPGFAAVSTTLAGQAGTRWPRFLVFDFLGAVLWVSGAVILGAVFHEAVEALLTTLEELGHVALAMLLCRHRAVRGLQMVAAPSFPARDPHGAHLLRRVARRIAVHARSWCSSTCAARKAARAAAGFRAASTCATSPSSRSTRTAPSSSTAIAPTMPRPRWSHAS